MPKAREVETPDHDRGWTSVVMSFTAGLANDWRTIKVVWHRELLRSLKERARFIGSLLQPILYLFVMGTGIASMVPIESGVPFRTFLFPGAMSMAVLFSCFFSAGSLVWDREVGFMREMMVAPIRRSSILLGKCLGGMTAGTLQGIIILGLGALAGVPVTAKLAVTIFLELLLISFALTAFGVALALQLRSIQSFMAVMQMVSPPMFFASGAIYPLRGLPTWLEVVTRLNPMTYAVAPLRHAVLEASGKGALAPAVTWGSYRVPASLDLAIVLLSSLLALAVSLPRFARDDA